MIKTKNSTIVHPVNGENNTHTNKLADKLLTALIGIATTLLIGTFSFAWNINKTITQVQDRIDNIYLSVDRIEGKTNNLQLDIRALSDRTIRVEEKQNIKPK